MECRQSADDDNVPLKPVRRQDCTGGVPLHGFSPLYSDLGYLLLGEGIARLLDEHASGGLDHSLMLWQLLVFEGFLANELPAAAHPANAALALA